MPERFSYTKGELNKLDPKADHYGLKIDSRHYEDGKVSGETHWLSYTPEEMEEIRALLVAIEERRIDG